MPNPGSNDAPEFNTGSSEDSGCSVNCAGVSPVADLFRLLLGCGLQNLAGRVSATVDELFGYKFHNFDNKIMKVNLHLPRKGVGQ